MKGVVSNRADQHAERRAQRRIVGWALGIALLVGLTGFSELFEDGLRALRNHIAPRPASGQIVTVGIDDEALHRFGNLPWPSERFAEIVEKADAAGVRVQLFDMMLRTSVRDDDRSRLKAAVARAGNVYVGHLTRGGLDGALVAPRRRDDLGPIAGHGDISVFYNYALSAWNVPYGWTVNGTVVPSMASLAAGVSGPADREFPIDWSIDVDSAPRYALSDLLDGRIGRRELAGRALFIAPTAIVLDDITVVPGVGRRPGVVNHVIGAETLLSGRPHRGGMVPPLVLAVVVAALLLARVRHNVGRRLALVAVVLFALALPLERSGWRFDIVPAMAFLLAAATALGWRVHRLRGLRDEVTGLANFNALRASRGMRDQPLVACRVLNYTQILSTLSGAEESQLADQILARLTVGAGERTTFVGDEGLFAWFAEPGTAIAHHVEALHALFRSPVLVGGRPFDVSLVFGVEIGSGRSPAARLGRALAAADEAAGEGLKWQFHNPDRVEDLGWRLSLLSQLDRALGNGEFWVAYQPQIDVATGAIVGAEALARWTHPDKGPIAPTEFIAAAEQGDRIDRLTDFVLDEAVRQAALVNAAGHRFEIAVNLSARVLADRRLAQRVAEILARHGLAPELLTLELTETAAIADGADIDLLLRLRDLGVAISIDDYGTGLSTLDYLKKVPAQEIKIDQSFIRTMVDNRSDRMMVQSTIALAHSLGRSVVAEGVEDAQLLELLKQMGCDRAQGFHLGRPSSIATIQRKMTRTKRSAAA